MISSLLIILLLIEIKYWFDLFYHRVIRDIVGCIEQNDLYNPIGLFIKESSKSIRRRIRRRSMYREILFLAIVALGREKISYGKFT